MSVQEEVLRLEISVGDTFRVDELLHKQQELVRPENSSKELVRRAPRLREAG